MKILFLTKRFYMSKDLIEDRYGRFYELPLHLCGLGHQISLICHSYKHREEIIQSGNADMTIMSFNLGSNPMPGFLKHYQRVDKIIIDNRPDVIIAASDCYQIILGSVLARRHAIPLVADIYDNFAYYKASRVPGVLPLFYRALNRADAITVVSNCLMKLVEKKTGDAARIYLQENAVSDGFLIRRDRQAARRHFNFQSDRIYIGTAGNLAREKGTEVLLNAFTRMTRQNSQLTLVLAGRNADNRRFAEQDNILYLGELSHGEIPLLFTAMDLGIICIKDNDFGRYCFPQRFYEMVACGLPLVASAVGEMSVLLKNYPSMLFQPENDDDLVRAINDQLRNRQQLAIPAPTWKMQAEKFDHLLGEIVR